MKRKAIGIGLILVLSLGSSVGALALERGNLVSDNFNFPAYQGADATSTLYKSTSNAGKIKKENGVGINVSARCGWQSHNNGNQISPNLVVSSNNQYPIDYYEASKHKGHNIFLRATPQKGVSNPTSATIGWHPDK